MIRDTFQRLSPIEFEKARAWYNRLREPEKDRVTETLCTLLENKLHLDGKNYEYAVIVAGSSIDARDYGDIDLFLLTNKTLYSGGEDRAFRPNPHTTLSSELSYGKLPRHAHFIHYRKTDLANEPSEAQLLEWGLGARVTISLFYELDGFETPREDHPNDMILPDRHIGAEELIAYNRGINAKFLVLARQYDQKSL